MRFPSRLVVSCSVLAALAATSGTALTMADRSVDAAVDVPEFAAAPDAGGSGTTTLAVGPPITGAQIAGTVLAPARDRATTLIAERAKADAEAAEAARLEAERAEDDDEDEDDEPPRRRGGGDNGYSRLADQIREACDDGRIRGQICR